MNHRVMALDIAARFDAWAAEGVAPRKRSQSNRASELGHPCARYLVYARTRADEAPPIDQTLSLIFREGNNHELDVKRVLNDLGIDMFGAQRDFAANAYNITGHVDVYTGRDGAVGVEIKSVNPNWWKRIDTGQSMLDMGMLVGRWYSQAQLYAFLSDLPGWLLLLKNKTTGAWKVVPIDLDFHHVEVLLDRATTVNRHISAGTLPDFHTDPSLCLRCPFRKGVCSPPIDHGEGALLLDDPLVLEAAETWAKHEAAGVEWTEADNYLRDCAKAAAPSRLGRHPFLVGRLLVTVAISDRQRRVYIELVAEAPNGQQAISNGLYIRSTELDTA